MSGSAVLLFDTAMPSFIHSSHFIHSLHSIPLQYPITLSHLIKSHACMQIDTLDVANCFDSYEYTNRTCPHISRI